MTEKNPYKIVVDTREQNPLWNGTDVVVKKLDVGDYSIVGYEDFICVERKSLLDLFGTLGKGHSRFNDEIERSKKLKYFAVVIEGSLSQCLLKDFGGSWFSQMRGNQILAILVTLHLKHGFPFYFTSSRSESKRLIKELFNGFCRMYGFPKDSYTVV